MTNQSPTGTPKKQPRQQLRDTQWWTIALLLVSAVIAVSALSLIYVPGWIVESTFSEYREQGKAIQQTALVNATSSARQTVTLAIGGIIAIVTFVLSLAKHRVTKQEHALERQKQELENAKHAREQEKHAQDRDSLWATRYSEAVSQFSNVNSDTIRLAGLYSLERIAQESQNDRQPILEVLCAFLRENCKVNRVQANGKISPINEITKTARDVMTRIVSMSPPTRLDLTSVDLMNASFADAVICNAQFGNANLSDADLEGADLSRSNLVGANLDGANLRNARLIEANMSLASLTDTFMTHANCIGMMAHSATFTKANIRKADLTRAKLQHSTIEYSDLTNVNLSHAILDNAKIENSDLTCTILSEARTRHTHFNNAYIYYDTHPDSQRYITPDDLAQATIDPTAPPQISP